MNIISKLDDQLKLPEDEALLLENVRSFARNEIAPRAAHHDETGEFPWENIKGINELGLNAMFIPEAYGGAGLRSEEPTSELKSLMRLSYAIFCLKKKN